MKRATLDYNKYTNAEQLSDYIAALNLPDKINNQLVTHTERLIELTRIEYYKKGKEAAKHDEEAATTD
jgi:hypothetical protein